MMSEQSTLIALTGKQKKPNPYQNKASCENLINDIDALLNGGGKEVNNPKDYKNEKGKLLLPDGTGAIKSSIKNRISDLKTDQHTLAENHRTKDKAHPVYGSYEGHQHFLENQQQALQMAITKFETQCKEKGYKLTQKDEELLNEAKKKAKEPIPQNPDRNPLDPASARTKVKDILPSWIDPKIINGIQKVVDKGRNYYEKGGGREQIQKILNDAGIAAAWISVILLTIGEGIKRGILGSQNSQNGNSVASISTEEGSINTSAATNQTTVNSANLTANPTGTALQFTNNLTTTPAKINESENIATNPTTTLIFDTLKYLNGESPPPVNTAAAKVADNPNSTTTSIDQTNQILASLLASNNPTVANNTPQQKTNAVNPGIQMSM
jgi:hypothetical protein